MNEQCTYSMKKADCVLAYITVANRSKEVIISFCSVLLRLHMQYFLCLLMSQLKKLVRNWKGSSGELSR